MDVSSTSVDVFTHKFFAPPSYPGAIFRTALLRRMFRDPRFGVVLVQAPAGHGKSTLLQQAKSAGEELGVCSGWLSFDQADNDLRCFTVHMLALLKALVPDAAEDHLPGDAVHDRLSDH